MVDHAFRLYYGLYDTEDLPTLPPTNSTTELGWNLSREGVDLFLKDMPEGSRFVIGVME